MEDQPMNERDQSIENGLGRIQSSSRISFLAEERSFWLVAAWIAGTVAFFKGVRFPNLWSAAEAQFDYRFGFIRRGFFGTYITAPLHLEHYARFIVVSLFLLLCAFSMLIAITVKIGVRDRICHGLPIALFFGSFAFSFLASLNGYLDTLLIVITLGLLTVRRSLVRFILAIPLCAVELLIHEPVFFLLLPVLLFSFAVDSMTDSRYWKKYLTYAGVLGFGCAVLTYSISSRPSMSVAQVELLQQSVASRIDFGPLDAVRQDLFAALVKSSADSREEMKSALHMRHFQRRLIFSKIIFFPTTLLFLALIVRLCANSERPGVRRYGLYLSCIASLIPLVMNAFGYDTTRWDTYVCLNAFLCFLLLVRGLPSVQLALSPAFRNASILVIMLNMATGELLLSPAHVSIYPFSASSEDLTQYLKHDR